MSVKWSSGPKSASEKYILVYGGAYRMHTTVVRLANNFGPRSNIKSPEFGFMNYFIGLGLQGKEITVYGKGNQLRTISYVEDSVEALIAASQNKASDGQAFFAVADDQCSVADIAKAIAENIGGKIRFVDWPKDREAIEIGDAIISNAKIKKALKWAPATSLKEGLQKTGKYFRPCLDKYL